MKTTTITATTTTTIADVIRSAGNGSQFISMETCTLLDDKMNKKRRDNKLPNPYFGAIKIARLNGLVNVDFTAAVNRRMAARGVESPNYQAGPVWFSHEMSENGGKLALVYHTTKTEQKYLQYFPVRKLGRSEYFLNGIRMTPEQVNDMKQNCFKPTYQSADKPMTRVYGLAGIRKLKMRKISLSSNAVDSIYNKFFPAMELNPTPGQKVGA